MMRVCVLSVLMVTWTHSVFGVTIKIYPSTCPRVNETVILNILNINTTLFRYSDWYKGQDTSASNQIIRIDSRGNIIPGTQLFKEAHVFPNGSLEITNAQKAHEGYYTVSVQTNELTQDTVFLCLADSTGLSAGAIAGICIGVLAVVAIMIGIVIYVYNKKSDPKSDARADVL